LIALAVLVFVPIRYLYPSRTPTLRALTVALGIAWGIMLLVMVWQLPEISVPLLWASLGFPLYYLVLSLVLAWRS
jgi:phosphatidylcholine synthase